MITDIILSNQVYTLIEKLDPPTEKQPAGAHHPTENTTYGPKSALVLIIHRTQTEAKHNLDHLPHAAVH